MPLGPYAYSNLSDDDAAGLSAVPHTTFVIDVAKYGYDLAFKDFAAMISAPLRPAWPRYGKRWLRASPGTPSRGAPRDLETTVALYRLYWEWSQARRGQGESPSYGQFATVKDWGILPAEMSAQFDSVLGWYREADAATIEGRIGAALKLLDPVGPALAELPRKEEQ